jgi:hypothetical protein
MDVDSFKMMSTSTVIKMVMSANDTALSVTANGVDQARLLQVASQVLHSQASIDDNVFTRAFDQPYVGSVAFKEVDFAG